MSLLKNTMDWNHVRVQTDVQLSQVIVGVPCDLHKGGRTSSEKGKSQGEEKSQVLQVSLNLSKCQSMNISIQNSFSLFQNNVFRIIQVQF